MTETAQYWVARNDDGSVRALVRHLPGEDPAVATPGDPRWEADRRLRHKLHGEDNLGYDEIDPEAAQRIWSAFAAREPGRR